MKPLISVITPSYNRSEFLIKCLENVIQQGRQDVEHLIIDGGSSDETVNILKRYSDRYPHIRWISEPDRGQSDAMNKGVALAQGSVIGMLNTDDYFCENTLNEVAEAFQNAEKPAFVTGHCRIVDPAGKVLYTVKVHTLDFRKLMRASRRYSFPPNSSAYFYHKVLHELIGFYDEDDHYSMDLDFILRAVQVTNIYCVDSFWGNFVEHPQSKTNEDSLNPSVNRANIVFDRYRHQLPLLQRPLSFFAQRWNCSRPIQKTLYYLTHPQNFSRKLKGRFFLA